MLRLLTSLLLLLSFSNGIAQTITWGIDFNTFFDNREGNNYYTPAITIFDTRLSPEIGLSLFNGTHRIAGGVSWIQGIGNGWKDYKICPTLYYRFNSPKWKFSFGMFPRTQYIEPLPNAYWSDELAYKEPNIRGALIQYVNTHGYAEFSLDWRGMQTETQREAFNVNFNGRWNPRRILVLGGHVMLNHLAKQKNPPAGQDIVDDILINLYLGADLSSKTPLDSLVIKAGFMMSLERDRRYDNWQSPCGALFDIVAEWKFLGIKNTLYAGKSLFPLYRDYGSLLNLGEPYYQAPLYNRTNIYAYIFRNRFVNLEASLNLHYTKESFGFQQQLLLRVYIDNKLWSTRKEPQKKGDYLRNIF